MPAKVAFLCQLARDNVDSLVTSLQIQYRFFEDYTAAERFYDHAYSLL